MIKVRPGIGSELHGVRHSLLGGSAFLFGGLMLSNGVAYLYQMVMARVMSPTDYGAFVTLTSISYVLAVLMRTVQAWVIRNVAGDQGTQPGRVRAIFGAALRIVAPMSALALVILWVAARPLVEFLHLGNAAPVIALACYTWSSLLVPLPRGALMGLNRVHLASAVHVIEPLVRLLAGVALVWWGWGVTGAVTGYSIGNLLGFALALLPLRRLLARAPAPAAAPRGILRLDRYAMLVLLINTALMLIASVDQIAVQHFFSGAVAGNYAVAFLLGRIIVMTTMALGWVLFTRSAIIAPDHPRRARVLLKSLGVIAALALTITAGFQIAPTLAVRLLGGAKYHLADDYLALVAIEMTLFALVYIQAYYHISIRKTQVVIPLGVAAGLEIVLLAAFHSSVEQMLGNLILLMAGLLVCVSVLSWGILRTPARLGQANVPDAGTPVADVG